MILDKPRGLICAGVFCVAAAVGGGARAAQVYPGCAVPPTTFHHIWYVDPVNGRSPAAGGNGSQTAPWNSLQGIVSWSPPAGYARPLLSSVPYFHRQPLPGTTERLYADQTGAIVQPGDEILLMSGQYGDVSIGTFRTAVANSAFVTIAAAPGQTAVLSMLGLAAASYFVFSGIKVEGTADSSPAHARFPLVLVGDHGPDEPSSNLVFTNMRVSSADDTSGWTQADWRARRRIGGIFARGSDHGANTTCVSVTDSHISNIEFGAAVLANKMLFSGNEIDHFGDDGIDYAASNISITKNYIHNSLDLADGAHIDAMQGYPGQFSNVVIDSNRVIRQTDPNLPFPTYLQGIDAFDGDWTNLTVTNNVVVTSSCWGIGFASVHGGIIVNNTVLDDGSDTGTKNPAGKIMCHPGINVGDKTHQGSSSNDVVMRNNVANGLTIYDSDPNMVMDHNICAGIVNGQCGILTFLNGKPKWGDFKPGVYGDHNIVDEGGNAGEFVNYDPAKLVFDLRLKAGARAIGAGNPDGAPAVDIKGARRGTRIDAGAYQYGPDK
jgi:Right handed beta helix region